LPVDLELRVRVGFRDGKTQLFYTLQSPAGIDGFAHRDIDGPAIQGSPEEYQALLSEKIRKLGERVDVDDSQLLRDEIRRKLEALGQDLYRQLFKGEMQQIYREIRRSITTLTIVSDEPWIPWELVKPFDASDPAEVIDDDFLCVQFELTRWLAGQRTPASEITVRRLACITTDPGVPNAEKDRNLLADLAGTHPGTEDASIAVTSAGEILAVLGKGGLDLLHVAGHGTFDQKQPDESALPLIDKGSFRAGDLTGTIAAQIGKDRPLVFLNACWIGQQAWSLTGLGGWADRWVRVCGSGAFIGPAWPVRDSLALTFAKAFYESLAQGKTFGQATRTARLAVRTANPGHPAWLTYTVYAHANGRIALGDAPALDEPKEKPAPPEIRRRILDFAPLIARKTEGFVGRQWLFDAVDGFVEKRKSGYVQILGDPGIGKTSVVAELVKRRRYPHHFNVRSEGIQKADQFLPNLCAQLVRDFDLGYSTLPPEASRDAQFLRTLLEKVAAKLQAANKKLLILVDALDEADPGSVTRGSNTLYLPSDLPPGVFVAVTSRRNAYRITFACEGHTIDLQTEEAAKNNFADVRLFTQSYASQEGIRAYIAAQGLDETTFVDELVKLSEGNFMYLHYVLPEIAKGTYTTRDFSALPAGLQSYYEDHWGRMKELDTQGWIDYKLPVLIALAIAKEPISVNLIADFSNVENSAHILQALEDWSQFLQPVEAQGDDGKPQKRYRLYHDSFLDFIGKKDQVEAGVNLVAANRQAADALWRSLYPEDGPPQ